MLHQGSLVHIKIYYVTLVRVRARGCVCGWGDDSSQRSDCLEAIRLPLSLFGAGSAHPCAYHWWLVSGLPVGSQFLTVIELLPAAVVVRA